MTKADPAVVPDRPGGDDPESRWDLSHRRYWPMCLQLLKLRWPRSRCWSGQAAVKITEFRRRNADLFRGPAPRVARNPGDMATVEALTRSVAEEFERYAKGQEEQSPKRPLAAASEATEPAKLADLGGPGHLGIEVAQKQELLVNLSLSERLEKV